MAESSRFEQPDWSAMSSMAKDLRSALGKAAGAQREALTVTGTAWSPDGMVKAVVGPRGHLIELDIDARVYRNPNSKALSATILATVRAATDDVQAQAAAILERNVPADLRDRTKATSGRLSPWELGRMNDADVREMLDREDNDERLQ